MKKLILTALSLISFSTFLISQNLIDKKPTVAIVDFDTRGYNINHSEVIQYTINELIRVDKFEIIDKYDIEYFIDRDSLNVKNCFSKICLSEIGEKLNADKMFTGSISKLGDKVIITLRLLDVKTKSFQDVHIKEFLVIPGSEFSMLRVCMNEMFGLPNQTDLVSKLTQKTEFDNSINNPYALRLRADGPRMGITYATGYLGDVLQKPLNKGGYDGVPYMFQFGYQFEKQYLNEGNFQALFEFIPMITGLDQGQLIPSITFLNGIRNNTNGWEFAFGPTLSLSRKANGYLNDNNEFIINASSSLTLAEEAASLNKPMQELPDSRGSETISFGFLFAAGKTIKSGKLNLPINIFVVPGKSGVRFGLSIGWNGKARYETP